MMPRHNTPPAAAQRTRSNARSFAATRQAARKTPAGSSIEYSTPCSVAAGSADHNAEAVPSAFVGRALAAPHPFDAPLEQGALVAAGKVVNRYLAIRGVAPEFAAAEENRRPGPEQYDARHRDELRQVGNPGVQAHQ